jgi:hypothetical protein
LQKFTSEVMTITEITKILVSGRFCKRTDQLNPPVIEIIILEVSRNYFCQNILALG